MNKLAPFIVLSLAALAATPQASAAPADGAGWFVGGYAGRASIDQDAYKGDDTGYGIAGGYRWQLFDWLSVGAEAGYNDLGNIDARNLFNGGEVVADRSKLHGWTAGINQRFAFGPHWYASVRGGVYGWKGQGLRNDTLTGDGQALDQLSWYAGAGAGFNISEHFSVGVNYDHFDAKKDGVDLSTNLASLAVEYRF